MAGADGSRALNRSHPYSDRCSMPALVCGHPAARLPGIPQALGDHPVRVGIGQAVPDR